MSVVSRRRFLAMGAGAVMTAAVADELLGTRTIFLPPRGGWPRAAHGPWCNCLSCCAPVELTEASLANAIRMMRENMRPRSEALRVVPTKVWMRPPVNAEHIRLVMYGDPWTRVDMP